MKIDDDDDAPNDILMSSMMKPSGSTMQPSKAQPDDYDNLS